MGKSDSLRFDWRNLPAHVEVLPVRAALVEQVEPRLFLSAAARTVELDGLRALGQVPPQQTAQVCQQPQIDGSAKRGYTPTQIRQSYGFDHIRFADSSNPSGSVAGDGAGQTIAIVDAYDHPNIESDLHTFSQAFGLSDPPNFTKISQSGGPTDAIRANPGWARQIALDVEWAHAIAPRAKILLVEANSSSLGDLLSAVDYARHAEGVSAVSMSWGTTGFWQQSEYETFFTTPPGHQGVTFVASSRDAGMHLDPLWRRGSSNVLSVGGTTLEVDDTAIHDTGDTDVSDSGWRFSTDADSGFAVYDSFGAMGWTVVGSAGAGAAQWAALIAIANQGRVLNSAAGLDNAGPLSRADQQYGQPGSDGSAFHDVAVGRTSWLIGAIGGYDGATRLGSTYGHSVVTTLVSNNVTIIVTNYFEQKPTPRAVHAGSEPTGDTLAPVAPAPTPASPPSAIPRTATPPAAALPVAASAPATLRVTSRSVSSQAADLVGAAATVTSATAVQTAGMLTSGTTLRGALAGTTGVFSRSLIALEGATGHTAAAFGEVAQALPAALASASATPKVVLSTISSPASAPRRIFEFARFGAPFTLLADSVAAFTEESALIPTSLSPNARSTRSAWLVTLSVIGVDSLLLTHYYRKCRKSRNASHRRKRVVMQAEEIERA